MSTESRIAVIVNANARAFAARAGHGHGQRDGDGDYHALLRMGAGRARFYLTRSRGELAQALTEARDRGVTTIIFCGGDGTYGAGITATRMAWGDAPLPSFGLGPGGTVGTVPRALGLGHRGSLAEAFARVLHEACAPHPGVLGTATLEVRLEHASQRPTSARARDCASEEASTSRIAFVVGAGLVSSFFSLYDPPAAELGDEQREFHPSRGRGRLAAALITGRVFAESFVGGAFARGILEPTPCDIDVDGRRLPWPASSLVLASVVRDVGLGLRVAHRAGEDVQRPHVIVSGLPPRRLGPRLPRVLRGVSIADEGEPMHYDGLTSRLVLRYGPRGGHLVVDGDLERVTSATVTAGPVLRLLAPH